MTGRRQLALVALLAAIYAVCYTAIKAGLPYAPPLRFGGLRAAIGGGALLAALTLTGRPVLPPRRLWGLIAALAATIVIAYSAMFMSPGRTGAGLASVLGNTGPLFLVGMARVFLGEHLTRAAKVALVLGFAGVTLIASPSFGAPGAVGLVAVLIPLLAAIGTATESVLFKRAQTGDAFVSVAAWQLLLGGAGLLLVSAWVEHTAEVIWTGQFVLLLAFLAFIGTALALTVWYWLAQRHAVGRLGLLLFLVPVLGLGLGTAVFGETIGRREFLGVVLTVSGLGALAVEWWITNGRENTDA